MSNLAFDLFYLKDKLPAEQQYCLVIHTDGQACTGVFYGNRKCFSMDGEGETWDTEEVFGWIPWTKNEKLIKEKLK